MTELLDNRTIQHFLMTQGLYSGKADGVYGPGTRNAITALLNKAGVVPIGWSEGRQRTGAEQVILRNLGFPIGNVDGYVGPQTLDALERYQNKIRDVEPPADQIAHMSTRWPREREVLEFYGKPGLNQVTATFPYRMRIAWNPQQTVTHFQCHAKVKDTFESVFHEALLHYGEEAIRDLGLDLFGGCLMVRPKKGGRAYSMHSWGIAIDLDPENNDLRTRKPKARFSRPEYLPFWMIVEKHGLISLGREKNYDWMHFQAARF